MMFKAKIPIVLYVYHHTLGLLMLFPRYFALFFLCLFISNNTLAQETTDTDIFSKQCPVPTYEQILPISPNDNDNAITILSKNSQIEKDQFAKFTGGVTLTNKSESIIADEIEINRKLSLINAQGNIHFQNKDIDIFASQLNANKLSNSTKLSDASYQLTNNVGHGNSKVIEVNLKGNLSLIDSSYTTCFGENPDWLMQASEINISSKDKQLQAYNARFKLFGVPVIYVPYFSLPIGNERQSGFLYPSFKSSDNSGFEMQTPYYLNITENMDATITPRYMSKRGLQLLTEFRYLTDLQSGIVNIEYLNKDNELNINKEPRYLARIQHVGTFSDRFRAFVDYTSISDDNYLIDLDSVQYNANDTYLYQQGELAYFGDSWRTTIKIQDFEVLGNHTPSYRTEPHIEISKQQALPFSNAIFDIYSELTRFTTSDKNLPEAERYHIEAGIKLPISTPAWFINSELKLLQTTYRQDNISLQSKLERNISRTLPKLRLHGGINFDREINYFNQDYTQTFEPQVQYLFISDKDQSGIGLYDTAILQDDFNGLFRDKRFSGLDRIAQANQYSWGVTSRILDSTNQEVFSLSIGRIVYLNHSNIKTDAASDIVADQSALATEVYMRLNNKWQFKSNVQYNTQTSKTTKSQTNIDYQFSKNQTIQLNHRYTRSVSGTSLEQVSLLGNVIVNKNWQLVGRLTQDFEQKRSIESFLGMQYSSCCWGIRLSYYRSINTNLDVQNLNNENRDTFDSGFKIEFVYNGTNNKQSSNNIVDMFNSSIFGYKRPYFLNN